MRSEVTWPTIPAMVRDCGAASRDAEAVVDGSRRIDFATLRAMVDDGGALAAGVGHRARRPGRGVGAELARVDRRRARRDDRRRCARTGQHAVPRRRGRVRPRPQPRAGAVHRARVPRHRLPGAARERGRRAARARAHDPALRRRRRRDRSAGTSSSARGARYPKPTSTRASSRSAPTIPATSCSPRERPAIRRAS